MMVFRVHQPKGRPNKDVYFIPIKVAIINLPYIAGMSMREQAKIAERFNKGKSLIFTEYF